MAAAAAASRGTDTWGVATAGLPPEAVTHGATACTAGT